MTLSRPLLLTTVLLVSACAATPEARVENRGADTAKWYEALPRAEWAAYERLLTDESWFELYRIRPSVTAIYEPGQFEEVISFLIEGEDRALLLDTGLGVDDMKRVVERLTDKPITVINSHSHYDHVGGNHAFDTVLAPSTEFGRDHAEGRPHHEVDEFVQPAWLGRKRLPEGFRRHDYVGRPYAVSGTLTDGHVIDLGGRRLEVLLIPGHSPDSLALLDRANRDLYIGDTFYLAPLYAHLEGSDAQNYRLTAARLADLAPQLDNVMTAHNVPIVSPDYLVALNAAFEAVDAGTVEGKPTDGAVEYNFDGFSLILPD